MQVTTCRKTFMLTVKHIFDVSTFILYLATWRDHLERLLLVRSNLSRFVSKVISSGSSHSLLSRTSSTHSDSNCSRCLGLNSLILLFPTWSSCKTQEQVKPTAGIVNTVLQKAQKKLKASSWTKALVCCIYL